MLRLGERLRALWSRARELLHSIPAGRRLWRATVLLAGGFRGEAITLRATALTYLTLFSLVPLLAVIYSVVDLVSGQEQLRFTLQNYVNQQLGLGAGAAIAGRLDEFTTKASIKALGAIGFAALLLSVLSLLWNMESAFNHIYAVKKPRSVLARLLKYWSFLTLGPLLLGASVTLTWKISELQGGHAQHDHPGHSEILHTLAALSSVAITYAGLALLYKVLPNARVRLRSALTAAFVAGTLWEVAKFVFAWGSTRMVQVHKIYGSLAVLPITLTWVYISWMIALVGCRLCYAMDASRKPPPHPLLRGAASREAFVARALVELARLHRGSGHAISLRKLALELEVSSRLVREAMLALQEHGGLALEVKSGGWVPGRELSQITLADLRRAGRATLRFPSLEADPLAQALLASWVAADGAASEALGETVSAFLARTVPDAPAAEPSPSPSPLGFPAPARGAR